MSSGLVPLLSSTTILLYVHSPSVHCSWGCSATGRKAQNNLPEVQSLTPSSLHYGTEEHRIKMTACRGVYIVGANLCIKVSDGDVHLLKNVCRKLTQRL